MRGRAMTEAAKLLVGSAVERMEDARFLSGSGNFADDLAVEGMLHAAILRSPIAHARIVAIDASAALAMVGIHAVLTAQYIGDTIPIIPLRLAPLPEFEPF